MHLDSFLQSVKRKLPENRGQTLVEYGLILVLIAIVLIVFVRVIGESVNSRYSNVYQSMP